MKGAKKDKLPEGAVLIAKNRKALFEYAVLEDYEAGIMLRGSEVKSLRNGKLQLMDAYAAVESGEMFLHHAHIGEYEQATYQNHDPTRPRKLLLHRAEIDKIGARVKEKGLTLIPLEVYFKGGRVKVKLGLCRGKAVHDKRATIRDRDQKRDIDRSLSGD